MTTSKTQAGFDVIIIGLGPVGATLAHLLGLLGIRTLVLEREAEAWHLPRAVHFDDEIMRVFQWIGVADSMLDIVRINPGMRFVAPDGNLLLDWPRPQERSRLGWHPSYRFHQPDLERVLREALRHRTDVTVRTHCTASAIDDQHEQVSVTYEDRNTGETSIAHASFVVGCDGARSLVRHAIGTTMEDLGFHERWLVVDVMLKRDMPALGDFTIQYCNPSRPATYVRTPGERRRWEITVLPDEASADITRPENVWQLLKRWITPDDADIERSAVYEFHSLIANHWRRGRLLIAGDAAHQTPPFMGQGMCAGIRDAANLGWKLANVIKGRASTDLLNTYQSERVPNAREFIETAVRLGSLINAADSEPALRSALPNPVGSRQMRSIYPPLGPGLGARPNAGALFSQPRMAEGDLMDDVIGHVPVIVAEAALARSLTAPHHIPVLTTDDAPDAADHLAAFDTRAVLLRPDRYIWASAESAEGLTEMTGVAWN